MAAAGAKEAGAGAAIGAKEDVAGGVGEVAGAAAPTTAEKEKAGER